MKLKASTGAFFALQAASASAIHSHSHLTHAHHHHYAARHALAEPKNVTLEARQGSTCALPTGQGLQIVTPDDSNAGWAMSPDQPCTEGNYCQYACPPGTLMTQWNFAILHYPSSVSLPIMILITIELTTTIARRSFLRPWRSTQTMVRTTLQAGSNKCRSD